jgi:hypothetical protein
MALFRRKTKIENLLSLVSQERTALLNGDTGALVEISAHKEKALDDILEARSKFAETELKYLATVCDEVQRLYSSAQLGLKSAHRRLQSLEQTKSSLKTYDAAGKNNSFPTISQEKFF